VPEITRRRFVGKSLEGAATMAATVMTTSAIAGEALPVRHTQNVQSLPPYEVFEITLQHDRRYANPFFDVEIDVTFTSPAGREVHVGGFHYGSLDRPKIEVVGNAPPGAKRKAVRYVFDRQDIWKARFAPSETGRWTYRYVFANREGASTTGSGAFQCVVDPRARNHGFVRRHPANPFRWVFEDGSAYFPIGLQDGVFDSTGVGSVLAAWSIDGGFRPDRKGRPVLPPGEMFKVGPPKQVSGEEYFNTYGRAGFNLFRFSQKNFSLPLYQDLDHYLVQEAAMVDELLRCVRKHGFRVFYGLFGYQPVFAEHPDSAEGMAKVKRFVKYSVDRWGAYVDFWEFLNEQKADARWYEIMSPYLRSVDPYQHPIATSWERPELPGIEINAPHWYVGIGDELGSDRQTAEMAERWRKFNKPVIVGEQGNVATKEELQVPGVGGAWDGRSAVRMRVRNWTALFHEIAFIFWNTSYAKDGHFMNIYLGPEERQYVRAMQDFAYRLDKDVHMAQVVVSDPKKVRGYGLASGQRAAVYLHHFASHQSDAGNVKVTLDVPQEARGYWYLPETGAPVGRIEVPAGHQTLEAPAFKVDLALLITRDAENG
jgi:hypothetical protein